MSEPGNPEFWSQVKDIGLRLGLISESEAEKYGGASNISDEQAEKVCHRVRLVLVLSLRSSIVHCLNDVLVYF
jgi:hypothetical protein